MMLIEERKYLQKKIVCLLLLLLAAGAVFLYGRFSVREEYGYLIYRDSSDRFTEQLQDGESVETGFVAEKEMELSGILLEFVDYGVSDQGGEIRITVTDRTDGRLLGESALPVATITEWVWQEFPFAPADISAGDEIHVSITAEGFTEENALSVVETPDGSKVALKVRTNLSDPVQKLQGITAWVLLILIAVIYYLLFFRKAKASTVFLIAFPVMVLLFSLLIPAKLGPDEEAHLNTVYKIAEQIEGWEGIAPDRSLITVEEKENMLTVEDPTHPYYNEYYRYLARSSGDESRIETSYWGSRENPAVTYAPAALGIVIGRRLHLSGAGIIMAGRIAAFIPVYLLLLYAIARIPLGKELLFTITMLPMMLQEAAAINADGIDIALSFALTAAVFRILLGERDRARFLDYGVMVVAALILSRCKYGALIPLCLLPLLLFFRLLRQRKAEGADKEQTILGIGAAVLTAVCVIVGFLPLLHTTVSAYGETLWAEHYTFSDILRDPLGILYLVGTTLYERTDFYVFTLGGSTLGWQNIMIPQYLVVVLLLIVLIASVPRQAEQEMIGTRTRVFLFLIAFLGAACAIGGMLIGWTEKGMTSIDGVQGRYFLPVLPALFLALQPRRISIEEDSTVRQKAMMAAVFMQALVVTALFVRL